MNNASSCTMKPCFESFDAAVERFGILVEKGGGLKAEEFIEMPTSIQITALRTFEAIKQLPDCFFYREVTEIVEYSIVGKPFHLCLHALTRAGYIIRKDHESKRVFYVLTDLTKSLDDESLAADIVAKIPMMIQATKLRKLPGLEPWQSYSVH